MNNNGGSNRHSFLGVIVFIMAFSFIVIGCGGGGGGSNGDEDTAEMVLTPSLGLIRDYTLEMSHADGTPISITTEVQPDYSVVVTYPASVTGPVYVEIFGNDTATYFDEASKSFLPFTVAQSFRTFMASPQAAAGVSALTELAASLLDNISTITTVLINQANELVRAALAPSLTSIVQPPLLIGSLADLGTLAATDAGKYAAILAAIAEMAASPGISSPVPAIVSQLVADIQDGIIDGFDLYGVGIADLIYNAPTFKTDFGTALDDVTTGTPLDTIDFETVNVNVGVLPDNGDNGVDLSGTIINPNSFFPGNWELFVDGVLDNEGQLSSGPVSYNFSPVNSGSSYEVRSSNEECMVSNATGTVADVDITNIDITCPAAPQEADLSGTISNPDSVAGQWQLLVDSVYENGGAMTDGAVVYNFSGVSDGSTYEVQSSNELCIVTNGTGTVAGGLDVIDIDITCTAPEPGADLSGTISNPDSVTGQWELFVDSVLANDGSLASGEVVYNSEGVSDGSSYEVRPSNVNCNVTNGTGTVTGGLDVIDIDITCTAPGPGYNLSGTLSNPDGLQGQWELFVDDVWTNDGWLTPEGAVSYNWEPIDDESTYEVRVSNEECSVTNGTGTVSGVDIIDINITCPPIT